VVEALRNFLEDAMPSCRHFRTDTVSGQQGDQGVQERFSSKASISFACCRRNPS
jgi:hypothetical protein